MLTEVAQNDAMIIMLTSHLFSKLDFIICSIDKESEIV